MVNALAMGVEVPQTYVQDGRIILNIAPSAVKDLFIHNDGLSFSARFGGIPTSIKVPMHAVMAIYARENGQGMYFEEDEEFTGAGDDPEPPKPPQPPQPPSNKRPALRVVK
jgi:stringent starvation protein B